MQRYESAMSWRAHDGEVYSVEFSYDENTVFSIGEDGKVCVFFILLKTNDDDTMSTCFGKGNRHTMCACVRSVHPVEHSSLWGEAVRAGFTQGRHRALRPVRVQWLQTGEERFLMEHR